MTGDYVDATFYAQVEPKYLHYDKSFITGAAVKRITQDKSTKPMAGTVTVKLTIRVPRAAFLPLRPEAVVVVPESLTDPHPVEVEVSDPT